MDNSNYIFLGRFIQKGTAMLVTDPANEFNICDATHKKWGGSKLFTNVQEGLWNTWLLKDIHPQWIKSPEEKITRELIVFYCPVSFDDKYIIHKKMYVNKDWTGPFSINVDSKLVGIFDFQYYRDDCNTMNFKIDNDSKGSGNKWYSMIDNVVKNKKHNAGVINNGVVTNCPWENGCYIVYVLKSDNKIVGIRIVL